ncbi:MAG: hypothetical protein O7G13_02110 [Alphaproteobacteria bacterium]|nr:hypothetical protein [Alphaproteobacteria bacterium]MCZ6838046.1 hypothetical protein [Alphaproteobacteria bacterium]
MGNADDQVSSIAKARHACWHKAFDTETNVACQIQRLRDDRIFP